MLGTILDAFFGTSSNVNVEDQEDQSLIRNKIRDEEEHREKRLRQQKELAFEDQIESKFLDDKRKARKALQSRLNAEWDVEIQNLTQKLNAQNNITEKEKEAEIEKLKENLSSKHDAERNKFFETWEAKEASLIEKRKEWIQISASELSIIHEKAVIDSFILEGFTEETVTADVIRIVGNKLSNWIESNIIGHEFSQIVLKAFDSDLSSLYNIQVPNPRIKLVHVSDAEKVIPNLDYNVYEGDVLFKHPFLPNTYVDAKTSEQEFFKEKLNYFSRVCQLLGAKSVSGKGMWTSLQKLELDASGNVSYKGVDLTGSYHEKERSRLEKSYELNDTFSSSAPNINEAEEVARKYGLYKEMKTLIEGRSCSSNRIQSKSVTITLSDELNKEKEIGFSLNAMKVFELSGTLKQTMETVSTVRYEINVEF